MVLEQIGFSIMSPLMSIWEGIINSVPGILGAVIILVVGYIVAMIISYIVDKVLGRIQFDKYVLEKTSASKTLGRFRLGHFLAIITKWYVFILFLPPAAGLVNMTSLSTFLLTVALWVPNVILAVVIALIGIGVAMYVDNKIKETDAKAAGLLAWLAKVCIYVFTALIVLDQIGVKIAIAQTSFLIILAGIMLAIALVIGLGFGFAFKDEAKSIIKDVKKKL
jgi:small-conductance mechanosensitive channel